MSQAQKPSQTPKGPAREGGTREGFGTISIVLAMLAFLCLGYVWGNVRYPPAGRYYGRELIYFIVAALLFNILGILGQPWSARGKRQDCSPTLRC